MKRTRKLKSIALLWAIAILTACTAPAAPATEAPVTEPATETVATEAPTTEQDATESASATEKDNAKESTIESEVVIIGTDAAAWTAAVRLTRMGKATILLSPESEEEFAKNETADAVLVTGSKWLENNGGEDTPTALLEDLGAMGVDTDSMSAHLLTERLGRTLDWMLVRGLSLEGEAPVADAAYKTDRLAKIEGGMNATLLAMQKNARDYDAKTLWETKDPTIMEAGGRVIGVRAKTADGDRVQIYARAVLVTEKNVNVRSMQTAPAFETEEAWKTDENMQVLGESGESIGGLYAAGLAVGGDWKEAPGADTAWRFVSGLIAAEKILQDCST